MEENKQINVVCQTLSDDCDKDIVKITKDGKIIFEVRDGEYGDNILGGNFGDCYDVMELLKRFYDLGIKGENISFKYEEINEEDL